MIPRMSVITDWRTREDALPNVAPGEEFERVIATQKFIILHQIIVHDMTLIHLEIGRVKDVPFELHSTDEPTRTYRYRLKGLDDEALKQKLLKTGAAVATRDTIAISPELEVRLLLRNDRGVPAKPCAALFVQEEKST